MNSLAHRPGRIDWKDSEVDFRDRAHFLDTAVAPDAEWVHRDRLAEHLQSWRDTGEAAHIAALALDTFAKAASGSGGSSAAHTPVVLVRIVHAGRPHSAFVRAGDLAAARTACLASAPRALVPSLRSAWIREENDSYPHFDRPGASKVETVLAVPAPRTKTISSCLLGDLASSEGATEARARTMPAPEAGSGRVAPARHSIATRSVVRQVKNGA